jgi:Tfp pilus assembly protein PilN
MKPVNLIPLDERRNNSVAGRSGGAVYVLLGALVVVVVLAATYSVAGRDVNDKRADLAATRAQANQLEAEAQRYAAYTTFAELRKTRTDMVAGIAHSRFDWARTLRELARTIPAGASLSSLTASVASGPSVQLQGCVPGGQKGAASLVSSLRRMEGVVRVSLASSDKGSSGGSTAGSSGTGGCMPGGATVSLTVFLTAPSSVAPAATGAETISTGGTK